MNDKRVATPAQCRAARAMLNWTQAVLAEQAGVARKTVADFELGARTLHLRTRRDITATLEEAGIEFTWGDEPDLTPVKGVIRGEGVRFARRHAKL